MENSNKPEEETWKDVVGYENLYEVSSFGRIKSKGKTVTYSQGKMVEYPSVIRKIEVHKLNGYCYIGFRLNKKSSKHRVHRLVAIAFIPNPKNLPQINHKDFNKTNNHVGNLEWCDAFHNQQHAQIKPNRKFQRHRLGMSGDKSVHSKPVLCFKDKVFIKEYVSATFAMKDTQVHQSKISAVCLGKRKSAGGYIWKFKNI